MTALLRRLAAFAFATLCVATPLQAYEPLRGAPFFLLSDASYGPEAEAMVRLEATSLSEVADIGGVDIRVYRIPKPLAAPAFRGMLRALAGRRRIGGRRA